MSQHNLWVWLSWKGRINRGPYLLTNCAAGLFYKAAERVFTDASVSTFEGTLWSMATVLISYFAIVVAIKRAHDRDRTGFFVLLFLVPVVNVWPIVELLFFRGTNGLNRFGDDPLRDAGIDRSRSPRPVASVPSSGEGSPHQQESIGRQEMPKTNRGFVIGLILGALTVLLAGLTVFYWMNIRVPDTLSPSAQSSDSKSASSEVQPPAVTRHAAPPDLQTAIEAINRSRGGRGTKDTTPWFQHSFNVAGADYHVVFTQLPQVDRKTGEVEDCHACGVMVDAITYKLVADRWEILSTQIAFTVSGENGQAPSIETPMQLRLSDTSDAVLISSHGVQGGYVYKGQSIYLFSSREWRDVGRLETGESNEGVCNPDDRKNSCYDYDGEVSVVPGGTGVFPDLVVVYSGTDEKGKTPSPVRYRFDGKEYMQMYR